MISSLRSAVRFGEWMDRGRTEFGADNDRAVAAQAVWFGIGHAGCGIVAGTESASVLSCMLQCDRAFPRNGGLIALLGEDEPVSAWWRCQSSSRLLGRGSMPSTSICSLRTSRGGVAVTSDGHGGREDLTRAGCDIRHYRPPSTHRAGLWCHGLLPAAASSTSTSPTDSPSWRRPARPGRTSRAARAATGLRFRSLPRAGVVQPPGPARRLQFVHGADG
jgi:hypothetical protein